MKCRIKVILVCFSAIVLSDLTLSEDLENASKELEFKDDNQEKWRAIELHSPISTDWIPADGPSHVYQPEDDSNEEPIVKRRRPGRKRKRKPQNSEQSDYALNDDPYSDTRIRRFRPRRPERLDLRREQWPDEMMAEEPFRPMRNYNRRRLYPKFEDSQENNEPTNVPIQETSVEHNDQPVEKIRDPYTALDEEENKRRSQKRKYNSDNKESGPSRAQNLKNLLKQSGGISLSELLQQKNLSLSDLLKGEQHAISALTGAPEQTEVPEIKKPEDKYKSNRLPPIKKSSDSFIDSNEYNSEKPLSTADSKQTESVVDDTTERRIFVPSHPKYYTSVDYKPNMNELKPKSTITTTSSTTVVPEKTSESISIVSSTVTFSTSENPTVKIKNKPRNNLPPTYAKLKNLTKTTIKPSQAPPKAFKINLQELYGVNKVENNATEITSEGPMKISVDLDRMVEKSKQIIDMNQNTPMNITNDQLKTEKQEVKAPLPNEKLKELSAKDEIMEILTDSVSRENLSKLLESRNMTLEELVEQRERGSSQRHLADIFHNQTKEPEPPEDKIVAEVIKPNSYLDQAPLFDTFPNFDRTDNNIVQGTFDLPSKTRESRQNQGATKDLDEYNLIGSPLFRAPTSKSKEVVSNFAPIWKQAYTNIQNNNQGLLSDKILEDDLILRDEAQRIEEIENKLAEAVNGALNIDVQNHKTYLDENDDENEFFRLPYGVRSAIIASAIIVGISLLVFLTIFIIFKWTQKQKKHLTYTNSFSNSKIKAPILETPYQRRIFGTIMNATLGRKKKLPTISCSQPQSFQEYLWENERKPFQ